MSFKPPPGAAAWRHHEARTGFEVVYFESLADGYRIDGYATGIEDGRTWAVKYTIRTDATWTTRSAQITATVGLRTRPDFA